MMMMMMMILHTESSHIQRERECVRERVRETKNTQAAVYARKAGTVRRVNW